MMAVERAALVKAARHPRIVARRAWFRLFSTEHCPVVKAILTGGRQIPADRQAWMTDIAKTHPVYDSSLATDRR